MAEPILVIGGGIGGLAFAIAAARAGLAPLVLEARTEFDDTGAGIQIGPNGVAILEAFGAAPHLAPHAVAPDHVVVRAAATGNGLARLPLGSWLAARHGAPYWTVHRADLHRALAATAERLSIPVRRNGRVIDLVETTDRIVATTADGTSIDGACTVVADGLWSSFRRRLPGGDRLIYAGQRAARALIPAAAAPAFARRPEVSLWLSPAAHVVHYPVRARASVAVVVVTTGPEPAEGWASPVPSAEIAAAVAGSTPELRELIAAGESWRQWALYDPPPLATWHTPRMALLGDAAHPMLPFFAQGGVMALEDAAVLGHALALTPDDPAAAFTDYERHRRPRVAAIQAASRRNGIAYHAAGPMAFARNAFFVAQGGAGMMRANDWVYGWRPDLG